MNGLATIKPRQAIKRYSASTVPPAGSSPHPIQALERRNRNRDHSPACHWGFWHMRNPQPLSRGLIRSF